MKKFLIVTICAIISASSPIYAEEILIPPYQASTPIPVTGSRKRVEVSTDILLIAMPVCTLGGSIIAGDWEGVGQNICSLGVAAGSSLLLKYTVNETRPDFSNNHSFPSAHTAGTFATATFLQRRYGWKLGAPAYLLATYVGWGRIYARKHHWWDVMAGAAIGAGSSLIFTRPWAKAHELSITPWSDTTHHGVEASFVF